VAFVGFDEHIFVAVEHDTGLGQISFHFFLSTNFGHLVFSGR
jgi:hypothetical protein